MRQIFIIALIILSFQNSFSQGYYEPQNRTGIKIMPFSMIDNNPRLRLGLEYISNDRIGVSIDFGIGNNVINHNRLKDTKWGQDYSLIEVRPEIKYLFKNRKYFYFYNSIECFYITMKDVLESDSYQLENSNKWISYDRARFSKQKYGVHFKVGINIIAYDKFNFDFYGGVGVAQRVISYSKVINPSEGYYDDWSDGDWFGESYDQEGKSVFVNLSLGVKFGYTFGGGHKTQK